MKRRAFVKNIAASSALATLGGGFLQNCSRSSKRHITILHTNDVHSHIDPFGPEHPRNPNMGGVARRASIVEAVRAENPDTLLLDAGDIFQGTAYFNYYGGELEFKLMSMLRYDAATIGNHDFDNGIEGLYAQLPNASFSFLSANYDLSNTILDGHVQPYKVFTKDEIRIGVFGLGIRLKGLVRPKDYKETKYIDPIEVSKDIVRELRDRQHCDLVICLSHLGFQYKTEDAPSDVVLAKSTSDIDLIIGGHTHTFLDAPVIETNAKGEPVLINQVGCYGINVGRIDFYLDSDKKASGRSILV